jgi:hypothetical protein
VDVSITHPLEGTYGSARSRIRNAYWLPKSGVVEEAAKDGAVGHTRTE